MDSQQEKLIRSLNKLLRGIDELLDAIKKQADSKDQNQEPEPQSAILTNPQPQIAQRTTNQDPHARNEVREWVKVGIDTLTLIAVVVYAGFTYSMMNQITKQTPEIVKSADAAKSAATTAANQLVLGERPWVKIKHRIVSPLTFDVGGRASGKDVALIKIEDTLENVGQTVALNVFEWEDVIPIDADYSISTARKRQAEYCDANRHPDPKGLAGYYLFPHDPWVQESTVGPTMDTVTEAVTRNRIVPGKVGFVLVGCVFYRSTFEPISAPTHQTRFIFYLAIPSNEGLFNPNVTPKGIASDLRLIDYPDGLTVD